MTQTKERTGFRALARRALIAVCALHGLAGAMLVATPAAADQTYLKVSERAYGANQTVTVGLNKSMIIDLPADAREVIVSQPSVANAIMRSKRRAIIQGTSSGSTNIFFLDAMGQAISVVDVTVGDNAGTLLAALRTILPNSNIQVASFGENGLVLSGTVDSGDDLQKALSIAARFAGDPERVANAITVSGSQQVMLKVVVAEVRRDTLKELGINLSGSLTVGNVQLGFNSSQTSRTNGTSLNASNGNFTLNAALRALTDRDALRLLAEPTLTAISGRPAEFLVGGELPIEVTDTSGRSNTEWKPFGVELEFTPTVKSNGIVALEINTAVSELRTDGALNKRSVATSVEVGFGDTLAIGGILQDSVRQQISGLPGLSRIPILGALFRSREYQRSQTELVVLVTPYKAEINAPVTLPTDAYQVSTDAEAIFLGQMEKNYGVGTNNFRGGYDGSIGFVLD